MKHEGKIDTRSAEDPDEGAIQKQWSPRMDPVVDKAARAAFAKACRWALPISWTFAALITLDQVRAYWLPLDWNLDGIYTYSDTLNTLSGALVGGAYKVLADLGLRSAVVYLEIWPLPVWLSVLVLAFYLLLQFLLGAVAILLVFRPIVGVTWDVVTERLKPTSLERDSRMPNRGAGSQD